MTNTLKISPVWWRQNSLLVSVLALLVSTLLTRAFFFEGLVFDQSIEIAHRSWDMANSLEAFQAGMNTIFHHAEGVNPVLELFIGFLFKLFGVSDFVAIIVPGLSCLGTGLLLLFLGHLWNRTSIGLFAMFLWLILPINIFVSSNLLPVLPMIFFNALAVTLYFWGRKRGSLFLYIFSVGIFIIGFFTSWTFFAASAALVLVDLARNSSFLSRVNLPGVVVLVALLFSILIGSGAFALDLYHLVRLVLDNLIIFPLLALAAVYVSFINKDKVPSSIVTWLVFKLVFLILGARWIADDSSLTEIGMAGYWIDLLVPGGLLISWVIVEKMGDRFIDDAILISSVGILLLLTVLLGLGSLPQWLLIASRIAWGLTIGGFVVLLIAWNSAEKVRTAAFSILLATLILGSLSIVRDYWSSYHYPIVDTKTLVASLESNQHVTLYVGGERIMDRLTYLAGFGLGEPTHQGLDLNLQPLESVEADSLPVGSNVVMTETYHDQVFGLIPDTWTLIQSISSSDQEVFLLYQVDPETSR